MSIFGRNPVNPDISLHKTMEAGIDPLHEIRLLKYTRYIYQQFMCITTTVSKCYQPPFPLPFPLHLIVL